VSSAFVCKSVKEILSILTKGVGEKVIFTIKESKYFAFQLDETTTVSNDSQLLATVYVRHGNRRQEVFNGGLDIPKFDENSTIYSVSHFNLRAWSFV